MKTILPTPLPFYEGPFQSGISDPKYPLSPPEDLEEPALYDRYKGIVNKQLSCTILRGNIGCTSRLELKTLLQVLTEYSYRAMLKAPSKNNLLPLDESKIPETYRVTVTVAFGYSMFVDSLGNDRFGLRGQKPKYLKPMPSFPGDDFDPKDEQSDLFINIASDSEFVNVSIARHFCEKVNAECQTRLNEKKAKTYFKVLSIDKGFGRPDEREFLRFNDGIDNLRSEIDLEELVYIDSRTDEPEWCINGSYTVYRKVREMMPIWEAFKDHKQSEMIGRDKASSAPLSRKKTGIANLTPVYPDPKDKKDGALNSHIRKVQPRRPTPDLFNIDDLDRRFLRRPYPYFDGVDDDGNSINGLLFVAYMKSIQQQFEHVTNMWQMNPDFPIPGTGIDAMYAKGVLKTVKGGYYFCPPAPSKGDFFGSGMFHEFGPKKYKIPSYIYGFGITFIDIDETVFNTFALVKVLKNGVVVELLNNQDFNTYKLKEGESFDFGEFKNAALFSKTSKPITKMFERVKEILHIITKKSRGSRIVFLTARSDFDNKELFLNTFRKFGLDMDSDRIYVERTGNIVNGKSVAENKKSVILSYLDDGIYRRVRLIDDNEENLKEFKSLVTSVPNEIIKKVRERHHLSEDENAISFSAYLALENGEMKEYT